jgi:Flp pilus assembly protein TadG
MTRFIRIFLRCRSGSSAAELALVLPLFLIFLFGIIDTGRFMWEFNKAEKATQVGARVAIVTNVLSSGLEDENYAGQTVDGTAIAAGGRIPAGALGTIKCTSTTCTCEAAPCPSDLGTLDTATFNDVLVERMQRIDPAITAANVVIRYSGSGMGFAGNSSSGSGGSGSGTEQMEISPLITVTLENLQFKPITSLLFATFSMPDFSTTLPAEDASGAYSN